MTIRISKSEMELLGYLHEHARGYGEMFGFKPQDICNGLSITPEQLQRDTSFLAGHNLANAKSLNLTTFDTGQIGYHRMISVWLTSEGENLMRKVEHDMEEELVNSPDYVPSKGVKITAKVAGWLMDKAADAVIAIVAAYITKS